MTELNQHGGGPTWWQRQDTFYAARWWAGACLAALNGGVDFLQFYKLVDDPPVFPGGPPHGRKPVYKAAKFINVHRGDQVVAFTCDHPEIAQAVTLSPDHSGATLLVANLFERAVDLEIQVEIPADMQNQDYCAKVHGLDENGERPVSHLPGVPTGPDLTAMPALQPQTIHSFDFQRSSISGDPDCDGGIPSVSEWGVIVTALLLGLAGAFILATRRPCGHVA